MDNFVIFFLFICLCLQSNKNDALNEIPMLVKMNIMEDKAREELVKVRRKMREISPDVVYRAWVGNFDYIYARHKIVGTVEIKYHRIFSVAENNSWISSESSNTKIIEHFAKYKITEIPSWDSKITCNITLNNSQAVAHVFIPEDILTERHSHNIKWEKTFV